MEEIGRAISWRAVVCGCALALVACSSSTQGSSAERSSSDAGDAGRDASGPDSGHRLVDAGTVPARDGGTADGGRSPGQEAGASCAPLVCSGTGCSLPLNPNVPVECIDNSAGRPIENARVAAGCGLVGLSRSAPPGVGGTSWYDAYTLALVGSSVDVGSALGPSGCEGRIPEPSCKLSICEPCARQADGGLPLPCTFADVMRAAGMGPADAGPRSDGGG